VYYSQNIAIFLPEMQAETAVPGRFFQHAGVLVSQSGVNMRCRRHGGIYRGIDLLATAPDVDVLDFERVVFRYGHFFKDMYVAALVSPIATDGIEGGLLTGRTLRRFGSGERDEVMRVNACQ